MATAVSGKPMRRFTDSGDAERLNCPTWRMVWSSAESVWIVGNQVHREYFIIVQICVLYCIVSTWQQWKPDHSHPLQVHVSLKALTMAAQEVGCTYTRRQPSPLLDLYGHINCKPIFLLHVPQVKGGRVDYRSHTQIGPWEPSTKALLSHLILLACSVVRTTICWQFGLPFMRAG